MDTFQAADQIAERINSGDYSQEVNAEVKIPRTDRLEDIKDLQVTVLPVSLESQPDSRVRNRETYSISVGIQKKVDGTRINEVRELHQLVREIQSHLDRFNLNVNGERAAWKNGTIDPIFSAQHLTQNGVFSSVIDLTYETET